MKKRIRLRADVADIIGRTELSIADLAKESGVAESTIHHLRNPSSNSERTGGGMLPKTAWKLANAFARLAKLDPDEAYRRLIEIEELAS